MMKHKILTALTILTAELSFRPSPKGAWRNLVLCSLILLSCSKWTEPEPLDYPEQDFTETGGEAWAEHTAAMRAYRQTDHNTVYVRLNNSPDGFTSEKDYMRCLPDSVDIVTLTNADRLSDYDIADLPLMKSLGIKVLYLIDWSARSGELSAEGALDAYLQKTIETVSRHGLDGWTIHGVYKYGDSAAASAGKKILARLTEVRTEEQLVVFEGDPLFFSDERDRRKLDYVVLDTEDKKTVSEVTLAATAAVRAGVRARNLLISARSAAVLADMEQNEYEALTSVADIVLNNSYGGIGVYDLADDYSSGDGNYALTRRTISILNPVK